MQELVELELLESYLPTMMPREEVEKIVAEAVVETGAASIKDMKKVMAAVRRLLRLFVFVCVPRVC